MLWCQINRCLRPAPRPDLIPRSCVRWGPARASPSPRPGSDWLAWNRGCASACERPSGSGRLPPAACATWMLNQLWRRRSQRTCRVASAPAPFCTAAPRAPRRRQERSVPHGGVRLCHRHPECVSAPRAPGSALRGTVPTSEPLPGPQATCTPDQVAVNPSVPTTPSGLIVHSNGSWSSGKHRCLWLWFHQKRGTGRMKDTSPGVRPHGHVLTSRGAPRSCRPEVLLGLHPMAAPCPQLPSSSWGLPADSPKPVGMSFW